MSPADADHLLAAYGRTGNPRDLAALFDATAPELFRVALATAPDAASAEDALQETFLTVMDAAPKFDASRRALPWLVGILKFKVAALRSRRFRSRGDEDTPPPPLADAPTDGEADPDELARVRAEIEHLSEPYRSVALLRWRYGLSPAEIAHVRGEPPGTVRSILSRSLERLRRGMRAVPAFFFGTRAERGLEGVRAHLLEAAGAKPGAIAKPAAVAHAAVAHAAASTATRAWIAGSLAAALLLTGAAILWNSGGAGGAPPPAGAPPTPPVLAADAAEKGNPPGLAGAGGNPRGMVGAAGAVRIRGTCVDIDRKPLAGVHLTVAAEIPDDDATQELSSLPTVGTSGADGAFEIGSPHAASRVVAFTDDGRFGIAAEARAGIDVEVVLRSPRRLKGSTVDEAGKAVAGARVLAHVFVGGLLIQREATSASDGGFSFELPAGAFPAFDPLDGQVYLLATASGRGACTRTVDLRRAGATVSLELGPPATWEVAVTAESTGAPVAGADVRAYGDLGAYRATIAGATNGAWSQQRSVLSDRVLSRGTTNDQGSALLTDVPFLLTEPRGGSGFSAWHLAIGVTAAGYAPETIAIPKDAKPPFRLAVVLRPSTSPAAPRDMPVSRPPAQPQAEYAIGVVDEAGVGVPAAHLFIESLGLSSRTDASGMGSLTVTGNLAEVMAKPRFVTASAAGYVRAMHPLPPAPPTSPLRIVLHRGGVIRGRVLEADGTPVSGCDMSAYAAGQEAASIRVRSQTDEAGWFRLEGVGEQPMVVVAERASRKPAATAMDKVRVETHDVRAGADPLELHLPREVLPVSARVVVTVVDEDTGAPVAAQYVRFRRGEQAIMVLSEAPGRMRVTQVPVGTWRVRVMAEGYPMTVSPFVVHEGDTELPLTLRIGRGLARGGEVRIPDGLGWDKRKLYFHAVDATLAVPSVEATVEGTTWKASSFRPGRYHALARDTASADQREHWVGRVLLDVAPGDSQAPIAVELVPAGTLRVTAPRDAPAVEAEYALSVRATDGTTLLDSRGLTRQANTPVLTEASLPPGTYAIRVTRPDGTFHEQTVTIRAQETTEVEVP